MLWSPTTETHERRGASDPPRRPSLPPDVSASPEPEHTVAPRRVMVVEDEVFVRLDMAQQFTAAGYQVVGLADTADEAVRLAIAEKPNIIVMDIRLRGKRDGIDAALEIRSLMNIPCVFVSANFDPATIQRAAAAQPRGFVRKPFTLAALLAAVKQRS